MRVKIYTKTGDAGETGLFGGGRVPKDHRRVEAYGEVDELNAAIGLARALEPSGFGDGLLQSIQRDLFTVGAELATPDRDKLPKALARSGAPLGESDVAALEDAIDTHEAKLAPRSEEHTSELQSPCNLVCRLLLETTNELH